MSDKGISITVSDEVRNWIAKNGYDSKYGARPIQRFVQEKIKRPLVDEVLFGKLEKGGHVNISLEKDEVAFDFHEKKKDKTEKKDKPEDKSESEEKAKSKT